MIRYVAKAHTNTYHCLIYVIANYSGEGRIVHLLTFDANLEQLFIKVSNLGFGNLIAYRINW